MLDALDALGGLMWAIISSAFTLYKTLTGIQNDFWATALGVSPFIAALFIFLIKKIFSTTKKK